MQKTARVLTFFHEKLAHAVQNGTSYTCLEISHRKTFDNTVLSGCLKKWDFICHILESGVSHYLSGVKTSRIQLATA